ncbi:MAG: DUF4383 domain-containing protein [Deltaproteobacteria bacterium]|nr:DUF4383 domain-containing protein [Deltaproteobacteria bacterium]
MAKTLALVFGIVFVVVGILGFVPNPIVGHDALFHTNSVHNLVHLIIGIVLLIGAGAGEGLSKTLLLVIGVVYLLVAVLGFLAVDETGKGMILNLVAINKADNLLHLVLGVVFIGAGRLK